VPWTGVISRAVANACPIPEVLRRTRSWLSMHSFTPENTLFANGTCRDEINSSVVKCFADHWGEQFDLAGLGGYPSAGLTGFDAYAHHVPDGGNLLVLYGPHIGVTAEGVLGIVRRSGMAHDSASCGALLTFLARVRNDPSYSVTEDPLDSEQNALERALLPSVAQILDHSDPTAAVTETAFEVIDQVVEQIIERSGVQDPIALVGGVVVNTPGCFDDWFAPRRAEVVNAGGVAGARASGLSELIGDGW
jgi:hypothetical protein